MHVVRQEIARRRRSRWLRLTPTGDPPDAAGPSADVESRNVIARYYAVLERLGASDRSIFVARTIEKLTLEEVAEHHGISVSTAQRRLTRATKRVAAMVRQDPSLAALAESDPVTGAQDQALVEALSEEARRVAATDGAGQPPPGAWHRLEARRAGDGARRAQAMVARPGAGRAGAGRRRVARVASRRARIAHVRGRGRHD